jgi:hypothetical protein
MTNDSVAKQLGNFIAHQAKKAPISAACKLTEAYIALKGGSREQADQTALQLAQFITMKPNGRAAKYLDHFLRGSGEPITFEMKELLAQDSLIRSRVELEIMRKMSVAADPTGAPRTPREKTNGVKVGTERHDWSVDPCVTLFQKSYSDQDWWFALGTFNVDWKLQMSAEGYHYVQLSGENEYKWHPEENRITQCLHRAGARLTSAGSGSNFMIRAIPCVIVLSEVKRKMVAMMAVHSFNPSSGLPSFSFRGLTERIKGLGD